MAGRVCIVEVEEIVEIGAIDPDHVHLPGLYVDRIVHNPTPEKRIEQRTVRHEARRWPGPAKRRRSAPPVRSPTAYTPPPASACRPWWRTTSPTQWPCGCCRDSAGSASPRSPSKTRAPPNGTAP